VVVKEVSNVETQQLQRGGSDGSDGHDSEIQESDSAHVNNDGRDSKIADSPDDEKKSQATLLVEMAKGAELFKDPDYGEAWVTFTIGGHSETYLVESEHFSLWLQRKCYETHRKPPHPQALKTAIATLKSEAIFNGREHRVNLRTAEHGGCIYIDMGDPAWHVIEVNAQGWQVVDKAPVKFSRPKGTAALPNPEGGGSLDELNQFLNVQTEDERALLKCWMLSAFMPRGPYPILLVHGPQGSGKSTLSKVLKKIIDPRTALLRAEPHDARDLIAAAKNSHLLVFDNLSRLPAALADAACRLSTGGGLGGRALYTNAEEIVFDATRPQIYNGIPELGPTRSDFLDRVIIIRLPEVKGRIAETELWGRFDKVKGRIFGALLDAISFSLRVDRKNIVGDLPRMADFVQLAISCEPALGLQPGTVLRAYEENRREVNSIALEASPFAETFLRFCRTQVPQGAKFPTIIWEGSSAHLLVELDDYLRELNSYTDNRVTRPWGWPGNAAALGAALSRLEPNLKDAGIEIRRRRSGIGRTLTIVATRAEIGELPSLPSLLSQRPDGESPEQCDAAFEQARPTGYLWLRQPQSALCDSWREICRQEKRPYISIVVDEEQDRAVVEFDLFPAIEILDAPGTFDAISEAFEHAPGDYHEHCGTNGVAVLRPSEALALVARLQEIFEADPRAEQKP
jgi:energy-coupling factor transporter ATP-binding protein EcfA2